MFTQCPQCETVYRLSADALGAAGGQVRCGRCGEVFDALKRLAEEPRMFVIGESTLELEARAEQILGSVEDLPRDGEDPAMPMEPSAQEDVAQLEVQDIGSDLSAELAELPAVAPAEEHALEFTLPPSDLDRIFVEEHGDLAHVPAIATTVAADLPAGSGADGTPGAADSGLHGAAQMPGEPDAAPPASRWQLLLWTAAALLLAVALLAQVGHRYRESLAALPGLGGWVRSLYERLGQPIPTPALLSGYELRQWGASGDATASGALRVRASILNTSMQMQPFPLLRVTLADRFGAHIGSRDFEPTDYLGRPVTRLLAPGERADATVDIQDPGKAAEGFELDVCLRDADHRIHCAGDSAPHP